VETSLSRLPLRLLFIKHELSIHGTRHSPWQRNLLGASYHNFASHTIYFYRDIAWSFPIIQSFCAAYVNNKIATASEISFAKNLQAAAAAAATAVDGDELSSEL
jgi:hypothetical protein